MCIRKHREHSTMTTANGVDTFTDSMGIFCVNKSADDISCFNGYNSTDLSNNDTNEANTGDISIHMHINLPLQIVVGLVSTVANLMTLLALSRIRAKFHPHLLLVVNLTISDMLFGVRTVVFRSLKLAQLFDDNLADWFDESNDPGCARGLIRVLGSAIYLCTYINLIAMAFDLYIGINKPFSYGKLMTRKKTMIIAVCIWIMALLLALANYIIALFHYIGKFRVSSYCEVRALYQKVDVFVYFSVVYVGICVMTYLYIRIFLEVRRCVRHTPGLPIKQVQSVKRNKRKVITSLLVLITFLVGWLPSGVLSTIYYIDPKVVSGTAVHIVGLYFASLPMMNSICDPVIYAIRLDKVRVGFRSLCGKPRRSSFEYYGSEMTEQLSVSALREP